MKKLNRIFATLIALLGVGSLSAQTWTAPVIGQDLKSVNSNTELYMYNVKADAFACAGMSWGTHAIVKELQNGDSKLSADVHRCRVSKSTNGQLQILLNERTYLGGGGPNSTNDCWVDHGSNNVYIYNEVSDNVYTLKPTTATNDSYLDCSWAYGGHITFSTTNGYGNTEWAFVLRSDITNGKYLLYKAKKEMYDIYTALKAAGHETTYATALSTANKVYTASNATAASVNAATKTLLATVAPALSSKYFAANSLFNNPDMRGYGDDTDWGNGLNAFADGIFESWHSAETITQKQTGLPNGFYTVVFLGMYRQDGSDAAPTLTLSSGRNKSSANLKSLAEIDFGNCSGGNKWTGANKPDNTYSAGEALAHTDAGVKVENFVVENGELTITVAMPSASQWLLCQGFQIYYKAESLEEYANLFHAAKTAAEAFGDDELNDYAAGVISAALSNASNEQLDKKWYQERTKELNDAVAIANTLVASYTNFRTLFNTSDNILNNSIELEEGARDTFAAIVDAAKTNVESATTADLINREYNTVEAARQTYVQKADPTNNISFDYTFRITNPNFDNGTNGWDCESNAQNKNTATNKTNGIITGAFFENWNGEVFTGSIYQNISGLPSGNYLLKVAAFGNGAYVFANSESTEVTTTDGAWYEVNVAVNGGNLTFGIKNEKSTNWMGIDNASLYYYGFDVATAQNGIVSLKSQAEALATRPMDAKILQALNDAIANADATVDTRNELNAIIETLNQAIENAKESIADYEIIAKSIAKANGIHTSIAEAYQAQYDNRSFTESSEIIFQTLEVATYNYVRNTFPYDVELLKADGWNSKGTNTAAGTFSNEHWSGETREYKNQQDGDNWGWSAQSWSIDFDQSVTLPAGEYVFKVAGRKSAEATLELTVTMGEAILGTVNDFPSTNEALGINKDGVASFDANDPAGFAKDGKGFGWQWRYVKFTLATESTVKVAVHAETSAIHQWVSFGDYTLHMDESAYLETNKEGLVAPMAAAETLIEAKPMGKEEIMILQNALDMPVTTGAELKAKIDALNSAIANAQAWIPKYNEAKVPLVAALERFEADYNDAENGALSHMNKERWATAINMAQAAALAKDVTDSYIGFEAAATNLVAALDAVSISANEYVALNKAIEETKIEGDNWGDQPFQKPESAKENINITKIQAQIAYDEASVDGDSITSIIGSLQTAMNDIELNAPEEGQRFYIKVATEGHNQYGNAILATLNETGENNLTGYEFNASNAVKAHLNQAFTFTQVEGNLYNISIERAEGTVYLTYGSINGSAAEWSKSQIQATTDEAKKGEFKIVATNDNGILKIYNTESGAYLDCQNDGSIFTDASNSNEEFNLELASESEVTLSIPATSWTTLILPFNAELPENIKAYSCEETAGDTLILEEVEDSIIKANTPYLIYGEENEYTFFGYGLAEKDSYQNGLFTGTYVDYQTTTNSHTYVLLENNATVAFHLVDEEVQPIVEAYHCYITSEDEDNNHILIFSIENDDTSVDHPTLNMDNAKLAIYDLMGRKVSTMKKGGIYIVNGVKILVK